MTIVKLDEQNTFSARLADALKSIQQSLDWYAIFILSLIIATCVKAESTNTLVSVLILVGFAFFVTKPMYLIGPIFFMTIFDDYLFAFSGKSFSRYLVIFFCVGVIIKIFIERQRPKYLAETIMVVIMLILGIVLSTRSVYGQESFPYTYVLNLVLFFFMMNAVPDNNDKIIEQIYICTVLAMVYMAILIMLNGPSERFDMRITIADYVNPNQTAMGMAQLMAVIIAYSVKNKKKIIALILAGILIAGIFLTGSRTALIAAVLSVFIVYIVSWWMSGSKKQKARVLIIIFSFSIVSIVLYFYFISKYPDLMARFTIQSVLATGGSARATVWRVLLIDALPGHYLFGIGFDSLNAVYAVYNYLGWQLGSHNLIVEILTRAGIIGLGIYLVFFILVFKKIVKNIRQNSELLMPFAMIAAIIINGIGERVLQTRFLWFAVGLVYLLLNRTLSQPKQLETDRINEDII